MEFVALGFIQTLQDILGTLFDSVLSPVLRDVFNILVNLLMEIVQDLLSSFLLKIWIIFLKLIGFMEGIFNVFSGVSNVEVADVSQRIPLLEYFFRLESVQTAFLLITAISVVLVFMTTIIGVAKSISDMALENKTPISYVLKQAVKAAVTFLIIPISCLFILQMATKTVTVFNTVFYETEENSTIGDLLFYTVAQPAAKSGTDAAKYKAGQRYQDGEQVKKDFDILKISYIQAYASSILVFLIMLAAILQFIQRILILVVLYLASPFFVSMMPLDGGAKFREWRNMFVAHMFSAFGPILAMKVYFVIVPVLLSEDVVFGVSAKVDACIRLFLIIGGAYAVYKSRLLIISVLNPAAAGAMGESGFLGGMLMGKIGGKISQSVKTAGQKDDSKKKKQVVSQQDQAYTGK